ncbi:MULTISPECIES: hypothetical protein [Streptomycetaceae]|nr:MULTISPECIES: hypothetical protein [Streptomycetaceae]CCB76429.1 protein of unknown function [Streptantibioticus cattleyicolor NRRL 8057 = DSM 46488]
MIRAAVFDVGPARAVHRGADRDRPADGRARRRAGRRAPPSAGPVPDGSAGIAPHGVYAEVRAIHDEVRPVSAKLGAGPQHAAQIADRETPLRILERARWPLPSIGALCGIAGVIASVIAIYHH